MLRFYTPADSKKPISSLFKIESEEDYINSILNLDLNINFLINQNKVHDNYKYIHDYLCKLIESCKGNIYFLGVYDVSKEAYFINKYNKKLFYIGDVSLSAIKIMTKYWKNVRLIETSFSQFKCNKNDLVVINMAEYFMNQDELKSFINNGANVVINNVQLYQENFLSFIFNTILETYFILKNLLSIFFNHSQFQFRGWIRTFNDFFDLSELSNKKLASVIYDNSKTRVRRFSVLYSAMFHYKSHN